MAAYFDLPVFKATYDLMLYICTISTHWPRDIRYTIGEQLKAELLSILQLIYLANGDAKKTPYIRKARATMVKARLLLRLVKDLKKISLHQYAFVAEKTEEVSNQLIKWENYMNSKNKEKTR